MKIEERKSRDENRGTKIWGRKSRDEGRLFRNALRHIFSHKPNNM